MGPVLFDVFIKGWNNDTESQIIKSVGDMGPGESGMELIVEPGFDTWSIIKSREPGR